MAESKSRAYTHGKEELYHNVRKDFTAINTPFGMPTQGPADNQRNGDRIFVSGFKVRLLCGQKYDRPNVTWKCWVLRMGNQVDTLANCWRTITGNVLLDPINTDQVTILKSYTWKPNRSSTLVATAGIENSHEFTFVKSFWVPYKKEYKFAVDNGNGHNDNPIVLFIAPYDAFGTLITDNIAYCQAFSEVFYRDP